MEQALLEEVVLELEEEVAGEEWAGLKLEQGPEEIVYVPPVEPVLLIRLDCRAIKLSVLNVAHQWWESRIISVARLKGETGKTTTPNGFARSQDNIQFLDCDVEKPNVHIFFSVRINPTIFTGD